MKAFPIERNEKLRVLMDAVARVRPALEAVAREAEETATLPRASVDALDESGLFLLKLPQALGGAEKPSLAKAGRLPCRGSRDALNKSLTASAFTPPPRHPVVPAQAGT